MIANIPSWSGTSLVRVKWLTAQVWDRYINKTHPISDSSLVDAVMLHHDVSTNNEIEITYLSFITHQAVKIWWFTFTPKIHNNDKNSTSTYK